MTSSYDIIENTNRTFTVVYGRAIISTHNSPEAAERAIAKYIKRQQRRKAEDSISYNTTLTIDKC